MKLQVYQWNYSGDVNFYAGNSVLKKLAVKMDDGMFHLGRDDNAKVGDVVNTECQRFATDDSIVFLRETAMISEIDTVEDGKGNKKKDIKVEVKSETCTINKADGKTTNFELLRDVYTKRKSSYYQKSHVNLIILDCLLMYIQYNSPYLYAEIEKVDPFNSGCVPCIDTVIQNVFKMCDNLEGAEKVFKSTSKALAKKMLRDPNFKLNEAKKIANVVDMPKFALDFMSVTHMSKLSDSFKQMHNMDGNTLKIFIEYLSNIRKFGPQKEKEMYYTKFCSNICELLERGYKITSLLKYLTRQQLLTQRMLSLPIEPSTLLLDYYNMSEDMGLKFDRTPQNIEKSHYIISKNYKVNNSEELKLKFKEKAKSMLKMEVIDKDFSLIVPKTVEDMIEEGNLLHHCVASYCKKVVMGEANVLFFRSTAAPNVPFVTIELDDYKNIVQAKGSWNEDVSDDILAEIKKLVKKIA